MARVYEQVFFGSKIVPASEANLSVASSAVLYGLSVYTVLPLCSTPQGLAAFRFKEHFARLINSCKIMGIDAFAAEWTEERFIGTIKQLAAANAVKEDVFVRASVHVTELVPGTRSRGLKTALSIFIYEAMPIIPQQGARLKTSFWRRNPDSSIPSRAKVNGGYVNSVLAKQDAIDSGYDDCVFLDAHDHVCELSAANIFLVRSGTLITPGSSADILEGINRRSILQFAKDMGIPTEERTVDLSELYIADEAFACGTSAFVAPIIEIDRRSIGNGSIGPITARLKQQHDEVLHGKDPKYASLLTLLS